MSFKSKTFRDPDARLYEFEQEMIRVVDRDFGDFLIGLMNSKSFQFLGGRLIETNQINPLEEAGALIDLPEDLEDKILFKHRKISFPSYPYEWPAEMLHAAGVLTTDIVAAILKDGAGLKDATPFNVLFDGPNPIFIDLASFERRRSGDPFWLPEGQLLRNFMYPLLLSREFETPIKDILINHRDGVTLEYVYPLLSTFKKITPSIFKMITLPILAEKIAGSKRDLHEVKSGKSPEMAEFVLEHLFKRLQKQLIKLNPSDRKNSFWSGYMAHHLSYDDADFETKERIVRSVIEDVKPKTVLDVGCNTGNFSRIAAELGATVVAIDTDEKSVGRVWREAHRDQLDILPLVVDLVNPTPATGWENRENDSFLTRADQKFDLTMMLAVVHHVMIDGGINVSEILRVARQMTTQVLLIEYVDPTDEMFKKLLRGREELYLDFNKDAFQAELQKLFSTVKEIKSLKGGMRILFLAEV